MTLLIDTDVILYKGLTSCQGFYNQIRSCDDRIVSLLERFPEDDPIFILGGPENFRKQLYPEYKANRPPKPENYYDVKEYLYKYWNCVESPQEADDMIGCLHNEDSIICSVDKDLLQLGGTYFDIGKWDFRDTNDPDLYFWIQCLCGDTTDSIPGVKNPEKAHHKNPPNFTWDSAKKLLEDRENRREIVEDAYYRQYGDDWFSKFDLTANLVFIQRKENQRYDEYFQIL